MRRSENAEPSPARVSISHKSVGECLSTAQLSSCEGAALHKKWTRRQGATPCYSHIIGGKERLTPNRCLVHKVQRWRKTLGDARTSN